MVYCSQAQCPSFHRSQDSCACLSLLIGRSEPGAQAAGDLRVRPRMVCVPAIRDHCFYAFCPLSDIRQGLGFKTMRDGVKEMAKETVLTPRL